MRRPGIDNALAKSPSTMVLGSCAALAHGRAEIQRVIHLIDDERDTARGQQLGQLALLVGRHHRTRWGCEAC